MKKIPTIFLRDWDGTLGPPGRYVLDEPHPDCAWVFAGEGSPTRKLDGTCCLVRDGRLYRRHEVKPPKGGGPLKEPPEGFELVEADLEVGTLAGWVPVGDGPEDRWHREAFHPDLEDGTYELVGPKVQGNPERFQHHLLVSHRSGTLLTHVMPTTYDGLRASLPLFDMEGVVWHHPDGRMGKIKAKDFGLTRVQPKETT